MFVAVLFTVFDFDVFLYVSPLPPHSTKQTSSLRSYFFNDANLNIKKCKIEKYSYNVLQMFIFGFGLVTLLCLFYYRLCNHVCYVAFSTNLNLYSVKKTILISPQCICIYLSLLILGLLLSGCENEQLLLFFICANPNIVVFVFALKCCKIISWTLFGTLPIYIFFTPVTPAASILCILVFKFGASLVANYTRSFIE